MGLVVGVGDDRELLEGGVVQEAALLNQGGARRQVPLLVVLHSQLLELVHE